VNGLVALSVKVQQLRQLAQPERREEVAALLPQLRELAHDEQVTPQNRINLLVRAGRAVYPRLVPAETPQEALTSLEEVLAAEPGPGRPPIGDPLTVRFPPDQAERIRAYALREGHVDGQGEPRLAVSVRNLVDVGLDHVNG
jgi:hypothetical protein